jgi:hypothetical protein
MHIHTATGARNEVKDHTYVLTMNEPCTHAVLHMQEGAGYTNQEQCAETRAQAVNKAINQEPDARKRAQAVDKATNQELCVGLRAQSVNKAINQEPVARKRAQAVNKAINQEPCAGTRAQAVDNANNNIQTTTLQKGNFVIKTEGLSTPRHDKNKTSASGMCNSLIKKNVPKTG